MSQASGTPLETPLAPQSLRAAPPSTIERASLARRAAIGALVLGVLADMLLRDGPLGIGLVLWMLVFAGTTTALVWRRGELTREQSLWLATAVLFASGLTWRNAEDLQFFDFVATLSILLVLGTTLRVPNGIHVFSSRVRDVVWGALRVVGDAAVGVILLLFRDTALHQAFPSERRTTAGRILRASIITVPLLILFGSLFRSADPLFDKLLRIPSFDMETAISHVLIAGFFAWIVGGWFRGAIVNDEARAVAPDGFPITLHTLELTVVLGALNVLFGAFVAVQIGWLFGGESLVRETTGLSLAQYARTGFFELITVSLLVLPVLLGANAALPAGDTAAATRFRRLSMPLLGLLGAVMVSALGRMSLYVRNYGLSTDRIEATAFMGWLAVVFVLFAFTVLRGAPKKFAGAMYVSGLAVLAGLNVASPDLIAARVNLGRAESDRGVPLDLQYLASLRDATPLAVSAIIAPVRAQPGTQAYNDAMKSRCQAAWTLLQWWQPNGRFNRSWTVWNLANARAREAVRDNEPVLRLIACEPTPPAFRPQPD